jgi:hypothetical protein
MQTEYHRPDQTNLLVYVRLVLSPYTSFWNARSSHFLVVDWSSSATFYWRIGQEFTPTSASESLTIVRDEGNGVSMSRQGIVSDTIDDMPRPIRKGNQWLSVCTYDHIRPIKSRPTISIEGCRISNSCIGTCVRRPMYASQMLQVLRHSRTSFRRPGHT